MDSNTTLSKFDFEELQKMNISDFIESEDQDNFKNLLTYIDDIAANNNISIKYVNETLIVYPDSYDLVKKGYEDQAYARFLTYTLNCDTNNGFSECEVESIEFFPDEDNPNINSLKEIADAMIDIKNKNTSDINMTEKEMKKLTKAKKQSQKLLAKRDKAITKLSKKLDSLRISEEEFLEALELYQDVSRLTT